MAQETDEQVVLPEYLRRTYTWAYLDPRNMRWLDRHVVVSFILWGNADRLMASAYREFSAGQEVLQPACVYGPFSRELSAVVGPTGYLEVRDIAPVQIAHTRPKLAGLSNTHLVRANAADPVGRDFDGVCCFFLLHEIPDDWKVRAVNSLLAAVRPGGKAVFVDYHKPLPYHPLKPIMFGVFKTLEPYAMGLWDVEISDFAEERDAFTWTKETFFGGLYQKVVAVRR
ncbi:rhodoquinone biosynthesis methyltransferase RquA [Pararhodospirillum oryzae]|uniref:rhodoquinone biosynthesis methyltransferase RquA n=1 Tax=Pararhodospirillum oryzae TaxID=478448 RepID=UPI001FE4DAD4|nr:rhodoquinone biosynthesis methyltransferase RquA [Pararhodospirillum oryzae]